MFRFVLLFALIGFAAGAAPPRARTYTVGGVGGPTRIRALIFPTHRYRVAAVLGPDVLCGAEGPLGPVGYRLRAGDVWTFGVPGRHVLTCETTDPQHPTVIEIGRVE